MKYPKKQWTIIAVLITAIVYLRHFKLESKSAPHISRKACRRADIQNVVQATGQTQSTPGTAVPRWARQVSGRFQTLNADLTRM